MSACLSTGIHNLPFPYAALLTQVGLPKVKSFLKVRDGEGSLTALYSVAAGAIISFSVLESL